MKVAAHFVARWDVFWATTYTFDLSMFDGFWFSRLGEPPLNATVLADEQRLAHLWQSIAPQEMWRVRRVNHDYLVRGIRAGSAFHPKTYLFANQREGVLLVGSGNLGSRGLDEGHEVFCQFDSRSAEGLATILAWRDWMENLVRRTDDAEVAARWLDAKRRTTWLTGAAINSPFVTNWSQSLLDQLCAGVSPPVDELRIMAPFYDEHATALKTLIHRISPRSTVLYACRGMSVDGNELAKVLTTSGTSLTVLSANEFVHAKLIGIEQGNAARLLSGSGNLSRAALLEVVESSASANVEAGVVIDLPIERMRAAFEAPDVAFTKIPIEALSAVRFAPGEEVVGGSVRLVSASVRPDGTIEIRTGGNVPENSQLTNGVESRALTASRTVGPMPRSGETPLVWVADLGGVQISNKVPLDDPIALRRFLNEREHSTTSTSLLESRDLQTPVGRMLECLHRECIFDIDDTPAARSASRDDEDRDAQDDFWDRLLQEELRLDPRRDRYLGTNRHDTAPLEGDLFGFLEMMRDEVQGIVTLRAIRDDAQAGGEGAGKRWSPERRLQLRLFNVLDRWCRSLSDPRLKWLHRTAPVRNYVALLAALIECWSQGFLPEERLIALSETLLGTFIRTERRLGYLAGLDDADREEAMLALTSASAPAATAALCYTALRSGMKEIKSYLFGWQPFLIAGRELNAIVPSERTVQLVQVMTGTDATLETINDRLEWSATYLDDEHWCSRVEHELDLVSVRLTADKVAERFGVTLEVRGTTDGIADPRIVALARRAMTYRKVRGAVIRFDGGIVSMVFGEPVRVKTTGPARSSSDVLTEELLQALESAGSGLDAIVETSSSVAS